MKKLIILIATALLMISIKIPSQNEVKAEIVSEGEEASTIVSNQLKRQVPMLSELFQVSTNQLLVTFDRPVDLNAGTKASNYWIQSGDMKPSGIASIGKNDTVYPKNSLTDDKVKITKVQGNNNSFLLTFKENIPSKKTFKLIVCYITVPGGGQYNGDNGMQVFVGK
ncbi:hypothetical protein V7056_17910 [Bacillus sp. JJ664]